MIIKRLRGFTLIELLAVIVVIAIIMTIATPVIINVIQDSRKGAFEASVMGLSKTVENEYMRRSALGENLEEISYIFENGVQTTAPEAAKNLDFSGKPPLDGYITVYPDGSYELGLTDGNYYVGKELEEKSLNETEEYVDQPVSPGAVLAVNVNAPVLSSGMTPIKWTGTEWVDTTFDDAEWYNYAEKKWANVRTDDCSVVGDPETCSMWVWIPRYAYRISEGYHTSTAGTIEIKFLTADTDTTEDSTQIDIVPTYNAGAQTNFVKHPFFTFGTEEITGFWVAKFHASPPVGSACANTPSSANCDNSTLIMKSIPSSIPWQYIDPGNAFAAARNVRTRTATYGFGVGEVDSFMQTNMSWGAIAYLSQSIYGMNDKIWINNNSSYMTGCAGNTSDAASTAGCNAYDTELGQNASTTGNVHGVYDMSGASWEHISAYINNGDSELMNKGSQMMLADAKYKDIYEPASPDNGVNNYNKYASDIPGGFWGDAVWEVSANHGNSMAWYGESINMPNSLWPWPVRGGRPTGGATAGIFNTMFAFGQAVAGYSYRPLLIITN